MKRLSDAVRPHLENARFGALSAMGNRNRGGFRHPCLVQIGIPSAAFIRTISYKEGLKSWRERNMSGKWKRNTKFNRVPTFSAVVKCIERYWSSQTNPIWNVPGLLTDLHNNAEHRYTPELARYYSVNVTPASMVADFHVSLDEYQRRRVRKR